MISTAAALAIGAGVSAAVGGGQMASAARANKRGVKFAREQMKWQEQQTDKARAWQEQQWNKQNAYDSAVQQRSRLQAAGLNPYLMMDGGSAGSATSMPSADTPQGVGNFDFKPVMDGSNGFLQAGDQLRNLALDAASVAKDNAETTGMEIRNQFLGLREAAELGLIKSQRDKNILEIQGQRMLNEWSEATMQARIEREKLINQIHTQEASKLSIENAIGQFNLEHLSEQWQTEMEERVANIYQMYANGHLSYKQAENQVAQAALVYAQKDGVEISNDIARKTASSIIFNTVTQNYSNAGYYGTDPNGGETNMYPDWNGDWKSFDKLTPTRQAYVNGQQRTIRNHRLQYTTTRGDSYHLGGQDIGLGGWSYNKSFTQWK